MRKTIAIIAVATEALGAAVYLWRRDPRIGSAFVNSVVNPGCCVAGWRGAGTPRSARLNTWAEVRHPTTDPGASGTDPGGVSRHGAARRAVRMGAQRHRRGELPSPAARSGYSLPNLGSSQRVT